MKYNFNFKKSDFCEKFPVLGFELDFRSNFENKVKTV